MTQVELGPPVEYLFREMHEGEAGGTFDRSSVLRPKDFNKLFEQLVFYIRVQQRAVVLFIESLQ